MTEGWTASLVKLGVHGNLEVVVVEVGGLLQYRQHVLRHSGETDRMFSGSNKS